MKDLTFETLIAVFEQIFGRGLFWAMVVAAVLVTVAFLYALIRDKGVISRYFLRAEIMAPVGAVAAILLVQFMTDSAFRDIGGPIDVIVLILIGLAGAGAAVFLAYTVQALLSKNEA